MLSAIGRISVAQNTIAIPKATITRRSVEVPEHADPEADAEQDDERPRGGLERRRRLREHGARREKGGKNHASIIPAMSEASQTAPPASLEEVRDGLAGAGYLASEAAALVSFLAYQLGKPVLVEGPAGVGKTELAKALSRWTERRLVRLQCYEGLDEAKALYEWNYRKQLLRIQTEAAGTGLAGRAGGHLLRGLPDGAAAPHGDLDAGAGRAADRRDRQDRPGVRGDAARGPVGLPDLDPGAGRRRGDDAAAGAAHLQQHARADRGAEAPLPVPVARLSRTPSASSRSCACTCPSCRRRSRAG